jgi:CFEM domain
MLIIYSLSLFIIFPVSRSILVARDYPSYPNYPNYPQCGHDLCITPIYYSSTCAQTGNSCQCQSVDFLSSWASCVGTLCPKDLADVFNALKANCQNNGAYAIPLNIDSWVAAGRIPWTVPAEAIFTVAPPTPSPQFNPDGYSNYPGCSRALCIVPAQYYGTTAPTNEVACASITGLSVSAACVGKLCPDDVSTVFSVIQKNCHDNGGYNLAISLDQWVAASHEDPLSAYFSLTKGQTSIVIPTYRFH